MTDGKNTPSNHLKLWSVITPHFHKICTFTSYRLFRIVTPIDLVFKSNLCHSYCLTPHYQAKLAMFGKERSLSQRERERSLSLSLLSKELLNKKITPPITGII